MKRYVLFAILLFYGAFKALPVATKLFTPYLAFTSPDARGGIIGIGMGSLALLASALLVVLTDFIGDVADEVISTL